MKYFIFAFLLVVSITLDALQMKREAYIDIPTANLNRGLYIDVNSSYPIRDVDDVKFDPNIGIDLSYKRFGVAVKWYDGADFALDVSYQILRDNGSFPGFAIGISELAANEYISSAGYEDVFNDESYGDRSPEIASVYVVGTKRFGRNFEVTAGIGRGKFVGYGPTSKYGNIDVFFDENHENMAFGLFGGMRIIFTTGLAFLAEGDGRDINIGIEYQNELIKGALALEKVEVLNNAENGLSPRIGFNLSYKIMDFQEKERKESKEFPAVIELIDEESRKPVKGYAVVTNTKRDTIEVSEFKDVHSFRLEPGIYNVFISAVGYKEREIAMAVKGEISKNLYTVELTQIEESGKVLEVEDSLKKTDDFEDIKYRLEGMTVRFTLREAELTPVACDVLNKIVELIRDKKNVHLLVTGHTCSIGTRESNRILSEKRVENVKGYLVEHGIRAGSISSRGYGESRPIADNSTEEGRIKNRRVEFILVRD